jgi:hypothetical protein
MRTIETGDQEISASGCRASANQAIREEKRME